jgi:hypothetical protein
MALAIRNAEMRIPLESTQIICVVESAERRGFLSRAAAFRVPARAYLAVSFAWRAVNSRGESGKFAWKAVKESSGLHSHHSYELGTVAIRLTLRQPAGCRS